jgi:uncharacterized membrane protein YcgQ (UPF0703/DUF1980 family)
MKIFLLIFSAFFVLAGCSYNGEYAPAFEGNSASSANEDEYETAANGENSENAEENIIEITDPYFDEQVQQIKRNRNDFLGRTIRFEGMFSSFVWQGEIYFTVARGGAGGCCGMHGFEVYLNEFSRFADETWVEVTGILEEFNVAGTPQTFLRLNVIELREA